MKLDEQAIREAHSAWIAAVNAGDLDRLLTMVTDDLVLMNPGEAPIGREEFAARFNGAHNKHRINCVSDLQEVVAVGDLAFARACDSLTVTPRAGGETVHLAGDRLTIYRKHPDGRWLLARDCHTLSPR